VVSDLVVSGPRPLRGRIRVPGDKSLSHRALLLAALAHGRSRITGLATGDDVARTRSAVAALGVGADGDVLTGGGPAALHEPEGVIDCGNSGTAVRLLAGLVAGIPGLTVLVGDASIARRPMGRVAEPLRAMGARIDGRAGGTLTPLVVRGGDLHGTRHELAVASAQVKSALLLAGLRADGETTVVEPAPSRDHTERMLASLGAPIRVDAAARSVTVRAPDAPWAGFEFTVPGDPSSAAFWIVGALVVPGSEVTVEHVALNPARIGFVDVLVRMGARIEVVPTGETMDEPVGDLHATSSTLRGTVVAGDEVPRVIDEIPVLAVAAACAEGVTEFRDAAELRVKESDRIATVHEELSRFGVGVEARPDGLVVRGAERLTPAEVRSHGDHRIAMAAAIAGLTAAGDTRVGGFDGVASSYPTFVDDLVRLTGSA
jgi:3-phosphoshikimate 1-carboxyvinyltransferase